MTKTTAPKAPRLTKAQKLAQAQNLDAAQRELDVRNAEGEDVSALSVNPETLVIETAAPKAPRLTKAQRLAAIELETQAIEAAQAAEKGEEYVPPVIVNPVTLEVSTIAVATPEDEAQGTTLDAAMTAVVKTKTMKVVKTVKTGVGAQILALIAQGELTNKEIVAKVLADNPMRKTSYACVAWYQSQVRAGKIDLPTVTEETEETDETSEE
jgi:hypothetical protein